MRVTVTRQTSAESKTWNTMSSPPPDDTPSSQLSTTSSKALLENAEYMEDLEGASDPKPPKPAADASVSSTPTGSKTASKPGAKAAAGSATTGNGKKRQLNLLDMLGGSTGQTYTAKRQRTTSNASASSASSSTSTEGGGAGIPRPPRIVNGLRPFNAIPFNMDAYKTSLSDEEKQLLALECETMGRTWVSPPFRFSFRSSQPPSAWKSIIVGDPELKQYSFFEFELARIHSSLIPFPFSSYRSRFPGL